MRTIKEFAAKVSAELGKILSQSEEITHDENNYIHLISARIVKELQTFLEQQASSKNKLTKATLKPFKEFLKKISEDYLQNTDAIIFHNSETHANRICEYIVNAIHEITNENKFQLMFPCLKLSKVGDDGDLRWGLISDDGRRLIDPLKCLRNARHTQNHQLLHTHLIDGMPDVLTVAEQDRVIFYNSATQAFSQDITNRVSAKALDKSQKASDDSLGLPVGSTYGAAGWSKLKSKLYDGIETREDLIKALNCYPHDVWHTFIDNYSFEELRHIFSKTDNATAPTLAFVDQDEKNDDAQAFVARKIFKRFASMVYNDRSLIEVLINYNDADRPYFLKHVDDKKLNKWMLGKETYDDKNFLNWTQQLRAYKEDESYYQAGVTIFANVRRRYIKSRTHEHSSMLGWMTGQGVGKSFKETTADIACYLLAKGCRPADLKAKILEVIDSDEKLTELFVDKPEPVILTPWERAKNKQACEQGTWGSFLTEISLDVHAEQLIRRPGIG